MGSRVAVIGSGYVGTVVAACLAHVGHDVVGVEVDKFKLRSLRDGTVPFHEPGLDELLTATLASGRLRFTDDFADAMDASDIVFICVGTPSTADGSPDLSATSAVARSIAENLRHYHVVVTKSTVPIGTGNWLRSVMERSAGADRAVQGMFGVVSNPEFLREGCAVDDFLFPDRVVLGSDDPLALEQVVELYQPILQRQVPGPDAEGDPVPLLQTDLITAELTKYACNAFLATKISFANEISRLCEYVGADVNGVTTAMGLDRRIGTQFLDAGIGWGGSCFGKDLAALRTTAQDYGYESRILGATMAVNDSQRQLVVDSLQRHLKTIRGARVALFGLAFKPGTDDLRDSPAVDIGRRLVRHGAFVTAHDPMVRELHHEPDIVVRSDPYAAAEGADALVVATDWPEFQALDLAELRSRMRGNLLFDGRNQFDPRTVAAFGFQYVGIGRGATRMPVGVAD
jgi:nucleotide sugar dehydrogenase